MKHFDFYHLWFVFPDENPLDAHHTVTWGPPITRTSKTAELTVGQKTPTDSPCVRRVELRKVIAERAG